MRKLCYEVQLSGCQRRVDTRQSQPYWKHFFGNFIFHDAKRLKNDIKTASLLCKAFQLEMLKSKIYFARGDSKRFSQQKLDFVIFLAKLQNILFFIHSGGKSGFLTTVFNKIGRISNINILKSSRSKFPILYKIGQTKRKCGQFGPTQTDLTSILVKFIT